MTKQKLCRRCGKPIPTIRINAVYCSRACKGKDNKRAKEASFRHFLNGFKSYVGCCECGCTDPAELLFHHINTARKNFNISQLHGYLRSYLEICKCEVRCRDCHKQRHAEINTLNAATVRTFLIDADNPDLRYLVSTGKARKSPEPLPYKAKAA